MLNSNGRDPKRLGEFRLPTTMIPLPNPYTRASNRVPLVCSPTAVICCFREYVVVVVPPEM